MVSNWIIYAGLAVAALLLGHIIGTRIAHHKADKHKKKNAVLLFIIRSIV